MPYTKTAEWNGKKTSRPGQWQLQYDEGDVDLFFLNFMFRVTYVHATVNGDLACLEATKMLLWITSLTERVARIKVNKQQAESIGSHGGRQHLDARG